ncbi:TOBE domain-containing protein [Rhodovulum iodosum]|uniref:TOBE domain-containing protein n=1 Tax=Rhodovulum iodosum TaxID=68291 RepID=UPI001FEB783B|nr:TOBE domain-containing protein [Rhodovulum robiginosum]
MPTRLPARCPDRPDPERRFGDGARGGPVQSSARNVLIGTVTAIIRGSVNARIDLALPGGHKLAAVITERSADEMRLCVGARVHALVKASFVMLAAGADGLAVSACNRVAGTVAARSDGPVNSEITLDIGENTMLVATITTTSAESLGLRPGATATALFKASHVILAIP